MSLGIRIRDKLGVWARVLVLQSRTRVMLIVSVRCIVKLLHCLRVSLLRRDTTTMATLIKEHIL